MTVRQSTKSTSRAQSRQKTSDTSTTARVTDTRRLRDASRMAAFVTDKYPMRQWAMWTHHQKHGWWSHVKDGNFDKIRFTIRDLDDLRQCWQRCKDEARFDSDMLAALDNVKARQSALDVAVDELRALVRRKARS